MKKFATVAVALLLLISLVGCGTFSYNINSYLTLADYNDANVVFIDKAKVDSAVEDALKNLIEAYPEIKDKTSGEVKDGDTVYIYYEGTLVLFNGETTIKVDSDEVKAVVGFNEALKAAEFKDGVAEFEITLDKAFTIPAFAKKAEEEKEDDTSKEETSEEAEEQSDVAEAAETSESTSTTTETSYFAEKKTKVIITVEGKTGKVSDGEELKCTLRWIHPDFEGGTYNKETEDEAAAEASESAASASTSEEEEEKRPGYELKIGSDSFIEGFEDGLIGLSVAANTKKTLSLTFPNPYSSNKALSGVDVEFAVTILSVTEEIERDPETQWDDLKAEILEESEEAAFDFANVGEYKAFVEEAKKMDLVATKMLYGSTMKKFPVSDYNKYKENYENYLYNQMFMQYFYTTYSTSAPDLATLVTKYGGFASLDAYNQHIADQAGLNLKRDLALYQVAKNEGLTNVSDEDIAEYISYSNNLSGSKTLTTENFNESFGGKDEANKAVVIYKAQKFLAEKAPVVTVSK